LRRLSEASARARLSHTVEEQDAELATDLMMESLSQVARDPEGGGFDMDYATGRASAPSQQARIDTIIQILDQRNDPVARKEFQNAIDAPDEKIESAIETLKNKGEIYEPQTGKFLKTN
jgi:replicative DNA helicase Mcm